MTEHDGPTLRDLGVQAVVVFGLAAVAGGIAIYKGTHTEVNSVTNDIDRDGRPSLTAENPSTNNTPSTETQSATQDSSPNTLRLETPPNCDTTPPGFITNPQTCADYRLVPDPRDPTRLCAEKGSFVLTPEEINKRTLWGLRWTVGEGLSREVEMIDPKTNKVIGYFTVGVPATFDRMIESAGNDTLACLVYPE